MRWCVWSSFPACQTSLLCTPYCPKALVSPRARRRGEGWRTRPACRRWDSFSTRLVKCRASYAGSWLPVSTGQTVGRSRPSTLLARTGPPPSLPPPRAAARRCPGARRGASGRPSASSGRPCPAVAPGPSWVGEGPRRDDIGGRTARVHCLGVGDAAGRGSEASSAARRRTGACRTRTRRRSHGDIPPLHTECPDH